jgi:hypothetical protein
MIYGIQKRYNLHCLSPKAHFVAAKSLKSTALEISELQERTRNIGATDLRFDDRIFLNQFIISIRFSALLIEADLIFRRERGDELIENAQFIFIRLLATRGESSLSLA